MPSNGSQAIDLTKWIVSALCALTLYMRNAVAFMLIFSGCISALMVKILKRIIKQPRPHQPDGQDYGMPSSHAASVCFFSTAIVLYQAHFIGVIACIFALDACFRRYRNQQHTIMQLVVGCVLGTINCGLTSRVLLANAAAVAQLDGFLKSSEGSLLCAVLGCVAALVVFQKELSSGLRK